MGSLSSLLPFGFLKSGICRILGAHKPYRHYKAVPHRWGLPISVNWTFTLLRLRRYERISVKNRRFRSNGASWLKISCRRVAPTKYFSSQKTRLNDLSYGIKVWTDLSSVLSQSTRLTDRQTDGRTDGRMDGRTDGRTAFSSLDRVCIPCSAVKIVCT